MSGEFAGTLRERLMPLRENGRDAAGAALPLAEGPAIRASVRAERPRSGAEAERLAAPARYRIDMRADIVPAVGAALSWRGARLVVLSVTHDPLTPGRVQLLAERR